MGSEEGRWNGQGKVGERREVKEIEGRWGCSTEVDF